MFGCDRLNGIDSISPPSLTNPFQHTPHNHNLIQVELFDFYAPLYDQHMKEGLLYTAPRLLRQEVRQVYNRTLLQQSECVN